MAKNISYSGDSIWDTEYKLEKYVRKKYPRSVVKVDITSIEYMRKVEIEIHTGPITKCIPFRRRYISKRLAGKARKHGVVGMKYKFKVL